MATIGTTNTNTAISMAFGYPPQNMMDVHPITGELWIVYRTASGGSISVAKSSDRGVTWSAQGSFTRTDIIDVCAMRIDAIGENMHLLFFVSDSQDRLYYKRIPIASGTASFATGEVQVANGGNPTPQAFLYGGDLVPIAREDGGIVVVFVNTRHGSSSGPTLAALTVVNDDVKSTVNSNNMFVSTRAWLTSGDDTAITATLDVEHNGNGITAATPNLWITWQAFGVIYCVKAAFQNFFTGWSTPASKYTVASGRTSVRDVIGRWDGARFLIGSIRPADTTKVDVFERPASNSGASIVRTTPSHPVGAINTFTICTNHVTRDFRVLATSGTSTVRYIDYFRATNSWGSWTQMSATAPTSTQPAEWGARRVSYGTNQYDAYQLTGSGPSWNVTNEIMAVNFAPTAPTWVTGTAGTVSYNGAAFDVSQSLLLDWEFNDPNTADTQGSYALSRQIGAGTIQYWRASDSTWQAAEVQNASATTQLTLTTGQWLGGGGAADPAHAYRVKTWDAANAPSAYSATLSLVPSTRYDPNITAPTGSPTLNSGVVAVTWTVTEQSAYRLEVRNTATGTNAYDSGFIADPTPLTPSVLAVTPDVVLPDGFTGQIRLTTRNVEGLQSVTDTENFVIDYVEPVAPVITGLTASPAAGGIQVTVTQPAPSGAQPASNLLACYRRKVVTTTPTNANPYFETNASDWTNSVYASIARSTAQFHQGVASLLLTPAGGFAAPKAETTTLYPAAPGSVWEWRGWVRSTTTNKTIRMYLDFYDGGNVFISQTVKDLTPVANTWIWGTMQGVAPPNTAAVRWAIGQIGTPASGDTMYVDEAVLIPANLNTGIRVAVSLNSGNSFFDTRAVSGVDYEYRGYAEGQNSTVIYGPWVA